MRSQIASSLTICTAFLVAIGCGQTAPPAPPVGAKTGTVTVVVKPSADADPTTNVIENVADGTTLESVMRQINGVSVQGSGTNAFVDSIGATETGAADGWIFKVDGEFANQGVGQTVLHPPTTITWTYGSYDGS